MCFKLTYLNRINPYCEFLIYKLGQFFFKFDVQSEPNQLTGKVTRHSRVDLSFNLKYLTVSYCSVKSPFTVCRDQKKQDPTKYPRNTFSLVTFLPIRARI